MKLFFSRRSIFGRLAVSLVGLALAGPLASQAQTR